MPGLQPWHHVQGCPHGPDSPSTWGALQAEETCLHSSHRGLLAPVEPDRPSQLLTEPPAPGTMGSNHPASLSTWQALQAAPALHPGQL